MGDGAVKASPPCGPTSKKDKVRCLCISSGTSKLPCEGQEQL